MKHVPTIKLSFYEKMSRFTSESTEITSVFSAGFQPDIVT